MIERQRGDPGAGCTPWGEISPKYQAMISSARSASDKEIRIVRARAIFRESSSLPLRDRWRRAEPRLATMAMNMTTRIGRTKGCSAFMRPSL